MKKNQNIILIGMAGAGKSTLGVLLAKALGMDFIDSDIIIQQRENRLLQEIIDADLYFIDKIGLKEHLSPTRSNGLLAMMKQMKMYALAFKTKGL